jgi:RNA polymerase sigma-70 factor, ECF subfamily
MLIASHSSDQGLDAAELSMKAEKAILALPERTRLVYTLIRSEEMSYKEVANTLSISTKAVEKEMMKALRILREALKEYLTIGALLVIIKHF